MSTIKEQFDEIAQRLIREGHEPVRVIFSNEGYLKARMEAADRFNGATSWSSYMGLPYTIRSDMAGEIALDYKFEERRDAVTVQLGFDARTGNILVDGKPYGEPIQMMQVIGGALTTAQLSDIIMAYVGAHPNEQPATDMLVDWVQTHGRFE